MTDQLIPESPTRTFQTMGMQSGDVSMTLVTRPDPDPIHAWDHLVSHTLGSDVSQLSAWSAVRGQAGFVPRYVLASFGGQPFRYPPAVGLLSSRLLRTGYGLFRRSATGGKVIALAERLMRGGVQ